MRLQVIYAPGIHGILLRNTRNDTWNGYTLLNQYQAENIDPYRVNLTATYLAPAGKIVSWMMRGVNGKLTQPISLNETEDFWLGRVLDAPMTHPYEFKRPLHELALFVNETQHILENL